MRETNFAFHEASGTAQQVDVLGQQRWSDRPAPR
jgi:hypothetical protein